jgi:hypothetical protein
MDIKTPITLPIEPSVVTMAVGDPHNPGSLGVAPGAGAPTTTVVRERFVMMSGRADMGRQPSGSIRHAFCHLCCRMWQAPSSPLALTVQIPPSVLLVARHDRGKRNKKIPRATRSIGSTTGAPTSLSQRAGRKVTPSRNDQAARFLNCLNVGLATGSTDMRPTHPMQG